MHCPRCNQELIPLMDACLRCQWNITTEKLDVRQPWWVHILRAAEFMLIIVIFGLLMLSVVLLCGILLSSP